MAPKKTPKKVAPKKASPTQTAASPKASANEKAAPKKAPANKKASTSQPKAAVKKVPSKKAPAQKAVAPKTAARKKAPAPAPVVEEEKPLAPVLEEVAKKSTRKKKGTPAVFKIKPKKQVAIVFTPEDALKVLRAQGKDKEPVKASAKSRLAAKRAPKKKSVADAPVVVEKRSFQAASIADILGFNPAVKAEKPLAQTNESKVPAKFKKYFKMLVALRDQLREEIHYHTEETLRRSSRDDSGDLSGYGQHQADAGTETFDRDLALSLVSSEQEALIEIEEAIQRVFNGSYGVCELTGQAISTERLEAVPFTRYSLEGQAQYERTRRRTLDRGNVFSDEDEDAPVLADDGDE